MTKYMRNGMLLGELSGINAIGHDGRLIGHYDIYSDRTFAYNGREYCNGDARVALICEYFDRAYPERANELFP